MKLSKVERWILSNQMQILEKVDPDNAEYYEKRRDALENGYEIYYDWMSEHILEEGLSESECTEVLKVLHMHDVLAYSYDKLEDKSGIEKFKVDFHGFDGNNETMHMAFAEFYCTEKRRYPRFTSFNSHMPSLGRYRAMLDEFNELPNKALLSKEEIIRVSNAR